MLIWQNIPATYAIKTNRRLCKPTEQHESQKVKSFIPLRNKTPLYSLSLHAHAYRNETIIISLGGRGQGNMSEGCRVDQKLERREVCSSITDYKVSLGKSLSISAWHLQNRMQ